MTGLLRRWRARIDRRHPSEDRLLEAVLGAPDGGAALSTARHIRRCGQCARRADDLRTFVETLADDAGASFDGAFPPVRLQAQRARIAHRLARTVGRVEPARILAFPFRRLPERRRDRPGRWAAAATAVGLALGMAAGQLVPLHVRPTPAPGAGATFATDPEPRGGTAVGAALDMTGTIELPPASTGDAAPAPLSLSEFEQVMAEAALLDALDVATISLPVTELASIDALTPRVPDLAATIR